MENPLKTIDFEVQESGTQKNITGKVVLHLDHEFAERFINLTSDVADTDEDESMIIKWVSGKVSYQKTLFPRSLIGNIDVSRRYDKIMDNYFYQLGIEVSGVGGVFYFTLYSRTTALEMYEYLCKWWRTGEV